MATVVAENPSYTEPSQENDKQLMGKLPELNPIQEEDESGQLSRPLSATKESSQELQLPQIIPSEKKEGISSENLLEILGLSESDSLGVLLKSVGSEVRSALEELTTITTHDDNLEKQYKETVAENQQLQAALDRARNEIRHLKGQLSILQMTPAEIRVERARTQQRDKKRQELEKQAQKAARSQLMERGTTVHVLTAAERARTVNAKGEYVDHQRVKNKPHHTRRSTYPAQGSKVKVATLLPSPPRSKVEPLPPPLFGCTCSECNAQQSLGALTLNRALCQYQAVNQVTKSGQQILFGDRVVLKGERLGTVCYIGRLDFDSVDHIYIGIHLDQPVGNIDGYLKGRRYFQCPPNHGVLVKAADIICVTGRKPITGGTAVPRVREKLPTGFEINRAATCSKASKISRFVDEDEDELIPIEMATSPHSSQNLNLEGADSVESMSKKIQQLAHKSSKKAKELQRLQEELKLRTPPTPPPMNVTLDESVHLSIAPPPRPVTPQPVTPASRPISAGPGEDGPPSANNEDDHPLRAETPLEQTLLERLSEKDLGATGFITIKELTVAMSQLPGKRAMTAAEVNELLLSMGVIVEEGIGIPYHTLVPHLVTAMEN